MAVKKAKITKVDRVEMFRVGLQIDGNGRRRYWTHSELDEMAEAYNSIAGQQHDAPILIGHDGRTMEQDQGLPDGTYEPPVKLMISNASYGWIVKAYREGDVLYGDLAYANTDLVASVNDRTYRKRSITIYPRDFDSNPTPGKYNIHSICYVGVPAVKGMADKDLIAASERSPELMVFMDAEFKYANPFAVIASVLQMSRERLIEASGVETANEQFPQAAIDALKECSSDPLVTLRDLSYFEEQLQSCQIAIARLSESLYALTTGEQSVSPYEESLMTKEKDVSGDAPVPTGPVANESATGKDQQYADLASRLADLEGRLTTAETQNTELRSRNDQLQTQVAGLQAHSEQLMAVQERDRVAAAVDRLIAERKVFPAERDNKIQLALAFSAAPIEFKEMDGSTTNTSPRERYLSDLGRGKPLWSNGSLPTNPQDDPHGFSEADSQFPDANFSRESAEQHAKISDLMIQGGLTYGEAFDRLLSAGSL